MGKINVSARVRLVLEIPVGDSWGPEVQFDQVHKQATKAALGALRDRNSPNRLINGATVVGVPKVTAVIVGEADGE